MGSLLPVLALMQDYDDTGAGIAGCLGGGLGCIIWLAVMAAVIAGLWKVFEKAGRPGWEAIVPIYNAYILTTQIARKEILWFILFLIPIVNIIAAVIVSIDVARKFGQGTGYGIGLALLPFIFYPMLGFGSAQYNPNA
jgi:hypothetical protein